MDQAAKDLIKQGDSLFEKTTDLMSLWQHTAEQFYPERADFTCSRGLGEEFASNLATSYPLLARRDLANTMGAMLRPRGEEWFKVKVRDRDFYNEREREAVEELSKIQRRAMYDRDSGFIRATTIGDNDWATFGQCVISCEFDRREMRLLHRAWHLRDVRWGESHDGKTIPIFRKWKATKQQLISEFGKREGATLDQKVLDCKDEWQEFNIYHIIVDTESYGGEKKFRTPYVSIYIDVENEHTIIEEASASKRYVIPRWQLVSGSQYAFSPATVIALPDSRLLQSITWTLLKAGELAIDPPMIAKEGIIRSDVGLFAGGITWVDAEYDERLGDAMRPLQVDKSGLSTGFNMQETIKATIQEAFFLNKISLPSVDMSGQMTAFEVGQRVQEYIRQAMPLFEPMEYEYNGALCEEDFSLLQNNGMFEGVFQSMPKTLSEADIEFSFVSPLSESIDKKNSHKLLEAKQMLAMVADVDQGSMKMFKFRDALRDALEGAGTPAKWLLSEDEMKALDEQEAQAQQMQSTMAQMSQGAQVAQQIGEASKSMQGMQGMF